MSRKPKFKSTTSHEVGVNLSSELLKLKEKMDARKDEKVSSANLHIKLPPKEKRELEAAKEQLGYDMKDIVRMAIRSALYSQSVSDRPLNEGRERLADIQPEALVGLRGPCKIQVATCSDGTIPQMSVHYSWVNQKHTHPQQIGGGSPLCPEQDADGGRIPLQKYLRKIVPGDLMFSYVDTRIIAVGIVASHGYDCPEPAESGKVGAYWSTMGWKVRVFSFVRTESQVRSGDHLGFSWHPYFRKGLNRHGPLVRRIRSMLPVFHPN
jgi:hypothetical protein